MAILIEGPTGLPSVIQVSPDNPQLPSGKSTATDMFESYMALHNDQASKASLHDSTFGQQFVALFGNAAANEDIKGVAPATPGLESNVGSLPNQQEFIPNFPFGNNSSENNVNDAGTASAAEPDAGSLQPGTTDPEASAFKYESGEARQGRADRIEMIDVNIGQPNGFGVDAGPYSISNTGYQLQSGDLGDELLPIS